MVAYKNSLVFLHDVRSEIVGRIDHEDNEMAAVSVSSLGCRVSVSCCGL